MGTLIQQRQREERRLDIATQFLAAQIATGRDIRHIDTPANMRAIMNLADKAITLNEDYKDD